MSDVPQLVVATSFQEGYIAACRHLMGRGWTARNLVVYIADPTALDQSLHQRVVEFARQHALHNPKNVAYSIFPWRLYERQGNIDCLLVRYLGARGLYERLRRLSPGMWGTYFYRMTAYPAADGPVNQLANVIKAIRSRSTVCRAAYTLVIPVPGGENVRRRGSPCLNYIAVQLEGGEARRASLLAVYRNHDFLERAYGNYWGMCLLLRFLARETGFCTGSVTCVSSHAYVPRLRRELRVLISSA